MKVQLQSVLLPTKQVCEISELYYHEKENKVEFDGYFNLFYIEKRKKYTCIDKLFLSVSLKGYHKLILMHDKKELKSIELFADEEKVYREAFPYEKFNDGVFWFCLVKENKLTVDTVIRGFFEAEVADEIQRTVNIGIDICTFRRETYIMRNLQQLTDRLLSDSNLDVSKHLRIYVIDNGQTLSKFTEIQEMINYNNGKIQILENMNAGGAGGFTRGMLEVLREKELYGLTHVLLMDDDAIVEPDSLVRIYGFLSTIKKEWEDMTIGGAMLREDYPHMLFCAGEKWEDGVILNPEMHLDLRDYEQASSAYLTKSGNEHEWYSGWWCCCYSLNTVREDNLPIPLFIHHDDIEFGLRNSNKGIVFLNGVGVWHRGAELLFPGANIYYDTRNNLIEVALHAAKNKKGVTRKIMFKAITSAIIRLKYKDAYLAYQGLLDFLKGPEWLYEQDPEQLNTQIRLRTYQFKNLKELEKEVSEREYTMIQLQINRFMNSFGIEEIIDSRTRKSKASIIHYLTYNGWLLPSDGDIVKVIFSTDSPFETFRKKKVVLYEPGSDKAVIVERDYREFFKLMRIYVKAFIAIGKYYDKAVQDYQNKIKTITNKFAWEKYLDII